MKDWEGHYHKIKGAAEEAISMVASGQRIFIEASCSEPFIMIEALVKEKDR